MNALIGPGTGRRWLTIAVSLSAVAFVACAAESGGGVAAGDATVTADASQDDQAGLAGTAPEGVNAGINQDCVRQVLGRDAAGFGDVTSAERDRILSECSGGDGTRAGAGRRGFPGGTGQFGDSQFGGGGFAAIDQECVRGIVSAAGIDGTPSADGTQADLTPITPEQRQRIVEECGGGAAPDGEGGTGGFGSGFFGRGGDGLFGGGGTRGDLFAQGGQLSECAATALGEDPAGSDEPPQLTPEDFQTIVEACGIGGLFEGFEGFGGGGFFGQDGDLAPR